jgi:hypothetical protein
MDALGVVVVNEPVDFRNEFAERCEAIRIAKLDFELVVEGFLITVAPTDSLSSIARFACCSSLIFL